MTNATTPPLVGAIAPVAAWLRAAPVAALVEIACRAGFAARGVVYVSVGALALLAAVDQIPRAAGTEAAMEAWARWPAGLALILATAAGLVGFAVWRFLQAGLDADGHGKSPRAVAIRLGQGISGLVHGALAFSLLKALDGLEDLTEEAQARETAAAILAVPFGDWVLIVVGAFVLATGVAGLVQAAVQDFGKRLRCSRRACRVASVFARIGYAGRALAFAPLGFLMLRAGLHLRSAEVRDLGGALQTLEQQPFGSVVLSLAAIGLIAFGVFAFVEAAWRGLDVPLQP